MVYFWGGGIHFDGLALSSFVKQNFRKRGNILSNFLKLKLTTLILLIDHDEDTTKTFWLTFFWDTV